MAEVFTIDAHETTASVGPATFVMAGPVTYVGSDGLPRSRRRLAAQMAIGDTTVCVLKESDALLEVVRLTLVSTSPDTYTASTVFYSTTGGLITFTPGATIDVYPFGPIELYFLTTVAQTIFGTLTHRSDDAGGSPGPQIFGYRNSASPAPGDFGFKVAADFNNGGGARFTGASFESFLEVATAGGEHAGWHFFSRFAGAQAFAATFYGDRLAAWLPLDMGGRELRTHGANNRFIGFSDGTLDYYGGGTRRLRVDNAGRIATGVTSSTNARFRADEDGATNQGGWFKATNAGYTGTVLVGQTTRAGDNAFTLLSLQTGDGADTEFRFSGLGNATADGTFSGGGADDAEMMLWEDRNAAGEDRDGLTVVAVGIDPASARPVVRPSRPDDDPAAIEGVVSARPNVIHGDEPMAWHGKWRRDRLGRLLGGRRQLSDAYDRRASRYVLDADGQPVMRPVKRLERVAERVAVRVERERQALRREIARAGNQPELLAALRAEHDRLMERLEQAGNDPKKMREIEDGAMIEVAAVAEREVEVDTEEPTPNPDYDPEAADYRPRSQRREWARVGTSGIVRVIAGQVTHPDWRRYGDLPDGIELWRVR